jgi:carbonic anhydrase/acetyltransferase-like protein (isoleucine patch superfamily)
MSVYKLDGVAPRIGPAGTYWIAPNAIVIGNVEISEDASIWWNVVIRGDLDVIRIGQGCNIQDGSVLHADPGIPLTLEENVSVGHMAMLHGCTIRRGSLIGIGAIVLNNAEIGEESLVGAGALIPEGKKFPPRSLIMGTPGKVVRSLTEDDLSRVRRTAENYQKRWKRYVAGLEQT